VAAVRVVIAHCSVDYQGRLTAHLPPARRLILVKADGCVSVHADAGGYKPLNWMVAPCALKEEGDRWLVTSRDGAERITITLHEVLADTSHELGEDPGLSKDGVEAHLQELLAARPDAIGEGYVLVRREYPTDIGPVDLLCRAVDGTGAAGAADAAARPTGGAAAGGAFVAVEIKRHATIQAVEQLTRYLSFLDRDSRLDPPVRGVLAAQSFAKQARTLAEDRGFRCVQIDYEVLRGAREPDLKLF
jgi:RecB family endonuclease NucS